MITASDIQTLDDVTDNVYLVQVKDDFEKRYVYYKTILRAIYYPRDTHSFVQEMRNILLFQGMPNIVQLVAVVTSERPYLTNPGRDSPDPLLEFYSGGGLESALEENNGKGSSWIHWPKQISEAVHQLHVKCVTHGHQAFEHSH